MENLKINSSLSKKEIYTLVKEGFVNCKIDNWQNVNGNYNHNTPYEKMLMLVKYGILSIDASIREGLYKTREQAPSNVNGRKYISVSKVEPYDWERDFYYNYDYPSYVNFVIDKNIRDVRCVLHDSTNYCNEYLIEDSVPMEYIKGIEVRLLDFINKCNCGNDWDYLIKRFNYFIDCVKYMLENNIDIPIIEASNDLNIILDKEKVLSLGKMVK